MKKIIAVISFVTLQVCGNLYAQDIHFSQFYENASLRNPALVGIMSGDYKAGAMFRSQWGTLSTPFTTVLASYETKIIVNREVQDYLSFGLTGASYKAGKTGFGTSSVYGTINYNKSLEDAHRTYMSFGFTAAYLQRSADFSKMTFANQYVGGTYSPENASNEMFKTNSITGFDLGAGVSLNGAVGGLKGSNYYAGIAAYNVISPDQSFLVNARALRRSMRWTGNLGFRATLNNIATLTIHANYQYQDPYNEAIVGALVGFRSTQMPDKNAFTTSIGCFYRIKDAIIPTVKFEYHSASLNFSYDFRSAGGFGTANFGSYEVSLFVRGYYKHKREYNDLKCPMFEDVILDDYGMSR